MIFRTIRFKAWVNRLRRRGKVLRFKNPVSLQNQLVEASRVCICMPRGDHDFYEARDVIHRIRDHDHWVMLILDRKKELLAEFSGKTEVYPAPQKKPFPIREESVRNIPVKFDIAIDLSTESDPVAAYITGTRGKRMTIGLKKGETDPFYTVLVNPGNDYKASVATMLELAGFRLRET